MMRFRMVGLILGIIFALAITVFAQDGTSPELQLTATQLIVDATETALASQGEIEATATDDPFILTSTALIAAATQTGAASGATPVPVTAQGDVFELTATQLIINATGTAENTVGTDSSNDGAASPLGFTLIAFGLVVIVLIILGAVYIFIASTNDKQQ